MKRTLAVLIVTAAAAVLAFVVAANLFPDWTWQVLNTAREAKTRIFGEKAPALELSKYVQQSNSPLPDPEETDYMRLSTPVVKAWREIPLGSPVYALDDAVAAKDWLERSLIDRVDVQTGVWYIVGEPRYTVFEISPYRTKGSRPPGVAQGIVLKVNGDLSTRDLIAAIRKRTPTARIDEYDIFGTADVRIQRHSRRHDVRH